MKRVVGTFLIGLAFVAFGCQHTITTPFPPGLNPIEADPAPAPAGTSTNAYPETVNVQQGSDDTSNYVHATGYVDAPIATVWTAFKDPTAVVDRHDIDGFTVTMNTEPTYDVSFITHCYRNAPVVGTVAFDLTWREGVVGGTESAPTQVSVVYQKTLGSSFISLEEGSIELTSVNNGAATELQFAQRMNATNTDSGTIATWTNGMFASIVALSHGQPLP